MNYKLIFLMLISTNFYTHSMQKPESLTKKAEEDEEQKRNETERLCHELLSQFATYKLESNTGTQRGVFCSTPTRAAVLNLFMHKDYKSLLFYACTTGNLCLVRACIDKEPSSVRLPSDLKFKINLAELPINFAAYAGHLKIVKLLWKNGALLDRNNPDCMPLILACIKNRYDIARYLLENGCDPNHQGSRIKPPIFFAINNNNLPIVRLLIKYKANVNAEASQRPLHVAVQENNVPITKALLKAGADIYAERTLDDKTPLDLATHPKIIKLINKHEAKLEKLKERQGKKKGK